MEIYKVGSDICEGGETGWDTEKKQQPMPEPSRGRGSRYKELLSLTPWHEEEEEGSGFPSSSLPLGVEKRQGCPHQPTQLGTASDGPGGLMTGRAGRQAVNFALLSLAPSPCPLARSSTHPSFPWKVAQ